MSYLAYRFGWSREDVWRIPIMERKMWVEQASELFRKENATEKSVIEEEFYYIDKCPKVKV